MLNNTLRCASKVTRRSFTVVARPRASFVARPSPALSIACKSASVVGPSFMPNRLIRRNYSDDAGLTRDFVQERILDLLSAYDKIPDISKVTPDSKFSEDLGLDSLDVVDVLYFIEEEFCIQIPDQAADEIHTVKQAVDYIIAQPDAV